MKFLIMRRRYTHTNPIKPFRIRNRFSHSDRNETAELHSYGNDFNNMLSKDVDMEDINDGLNYDNEEIFVEDDMITKSSDNEEEDEGEGNNDDNDEEWEGTVIHFSHILIFTG